MVEVQALKGFVHGGRRMIGDRFFVSPHDAKLLAAKALVFIETEGIIESNPTPAAGENSAVSPAAPVSPSPIAAPRKRGRPRKQPVESLS